MRPALPVGLCCYNPLMEYKNRKARQYTITDEYIAGIVLTGAEAKSIKAGRMKLDGSYAKIRNNEVFLVGAIIPQYKYSSLKDYDQQRTRKLLLSKAEIISLQTKIQSGRLTLIPLSCYTSRGLVKMRLGLARGKKMHEKRDELKKRDSKREIERALKNY